MKLPGRILKIMHALAAGCVFYGGAAAQEPVPSFAVVDFVLVDLPGKLDKASTWDVSFELRLINETARHQAMKAGKLKQMQDEEKIGELVYQGSFSGKPTVNPEDRRVTINIPLTADVRAKLLNEPKDRIDLTRVKIDPQVIAQSRAEEAKAQVFLLYANAIVFDAKSKKTTIVPMGQVLSFRQNPSLKFVRAITVTENGYSLDSGLSTDNVIKTLSKPL